MGALLPPALLLASAQSDLATISPRPPPILGVPQQLHQKVCRCRGEDRLVRVEFRRVDPIRVAAEALYELARSRCADVKDVRARVRRPRSEQDGAVHRQPRMLVGISAVVSVDGRGCATLLTGGPPPL
eukprot:CAMPEP_0181228806 /NCGR_PEP_ID=MMETSP1096-20121128/33549_1 /TAXON_ID=156174 ORGANISM="Chrysochromulina ericina, Strain CCMP281" /NCGR_SAMPLE_ID=MMETSP1096 /ASSEMBLY_ACC=CAM_ASM_000453 /LENGTH=127 /DNA_ID=CAMNT_0023322365 /DNA_START=354 /DNA_END=737 /DNA_ORIENTATION=-